MALKSVVMLKSMIKRAIHKHKNRRADHDHTKHRKSIKVRRTSSNIPTSTPPHSRPPLAASTSTSTTTTLSSASTAFDCPPLPFKTPISLETDPMPTPPAIYPAPHVPNQPPISPLQSPTTPTSASMATTPTASHFPPYASRRHSVSSHRRQSSAGSTGSDLPSPRRSSFETPRSRRNSETLHQSVPFQEEWQDDRRTQEDLMAQFRKEVDSVHEAVVGEEGVIEEEVESGTVTPSADQQQQAAIPPAEQLLFMANKGSTASVDVVVRDVHGEENLVLCAEDGAQDEGEPEREIYDDDYWQEPEVPHESEEKRLSRLSRLSRSSSAGPQRYLAYHLSQSIKIRDFAHPSMSPLHYGLPPSPSTPTPATPSSQRSSRALSEASDFTGRQARALYDFDAENPSECSFHEGELIWVQYRQCPGWLVADVRDETGLVPENYVEILDGQPVDEPEELTEVTMRKQEQLEV